MAASEHDGDPGYDGSNTTGFVSPAADALEGPIDLAALLDLRRPHRYPVRVLGEALVDRGIYPGDVLIADTATAPTHGRVAIVMLHGEVWIAQLALRDGQWRMLPCRRWTGRVGCLPSFACRAARRLPPCIRRSRHRQRNEAWQGRRCRFCYG